MSAERSTRGPKAAGSNASASRPGQGCRSEHRRCDSPWRAPLQRLVPLETWVYENANVRAIWWTSPRLTSPADMGRWLRRHEQRLTSRGALLRMGRAWRIVEPVFRTELFAILGEEYANKRRS